MKKISLLFVLALMVFIGTRCATEEITEVRQPIEMDMRFDVNGSEQIIRVTFIYRENENRYVLRSDEVVEVIAIHEITREKIFGYYLKASPGGRVPYEIRVGYVGYSPSTGCWYYGTLYVDDNGESLFVPGSIENQLLNPPLCGYYYA